YGMLFLLSTDYQGPKDVIQGTHYEASPKSKHQRLPIRADENKADHKRYPDESGPHEGNNRSDRAEQPPQHRRTNSQKPETQAEKQSLRQSYREYAVYVGHDGVMRNPQQVSGDVRPEGNESRAASQPTFAMAQQIVQQYVGQHSDDED